MYPTPQQYSPVAPYETPRRRRLSFGPFLVVLPLVLFAGLFFGLSFLASPEPDIEVQQGVGHARVQGRDVVLVPYARHGARGMFQLIFRDMFQVRLSATDPATGESLWDTQLSDELIWEADVLGAGDKYAYVATDSGLRILDLADGDLVAQGDGITGLGSGYVAARGAYAYDPEGGRVLAMNANGDVLAIPVDQTAAAPVDQATAAAWVGRLTTDHKTVRYDTTKREAAVDGGQLVVRERPNGAPGKVLVRVAADGQETPVGDAAFQNASIVVDGDRAAGAAAGSVLVHHQRSVNDKGWAVSLVSLATGQVTGTQPVASSLTRVLTTPDGGTLVTTDDGVLTARDGKLTALAVGATDFFGSPS
ncbi:PA2928 family protein [Actinosynnema sp. NPDC020468]|uniref:PA2928 family protein n=1 Tax=Actinosynnema sp. NPDC020468 TaxID=3154488 RepID=UPI0033D4BBA2